MEPTSIYHKAKRNLAIFAGLLVLVALGGIEVKNPSNFSVLPFQIKDSSKILHVIFAISAYCYYQYWWSWYVQTDEVRSKVRWDFFVTTAVSILIFGVYFWVVVAPLIAQVSASLAEWLSVILGVVTAITASFAARASSELFKRSKQIFSIRRETIKDRLLNPGWMLLYNPVNGGQKKISFESDGSVGEGRNDNESRWKLEDDDTLLIFKSDGSLHNRFTYDPNFDRFVSGQPDSKLGLLGQTVYRPEVLMAAMGGSPQEHYY